MDEAGFCNIFGSRNAPKTLTLEKRKGAFKMALRERKKREKEIPFLRRVLRRAFVV